ncbi:MAG: helix-turn-helix transcriptional regulator [Treponema sp.]|jgi:transcriptional regulator with XRE-family HTH domain|nr:helix-turn-helix transcriptional regulator [Treponema sp.]
MKDRIRAIRKALKLSQSEFAERLGIKGAALSMVELGKNALTEQNARLVCMTFNVNDAWLRSGKGEMFAASPYEKEFFEIYRGLMPETQRALLRLAQDLLESQKNLLNGGKKFL